jgi:hypothetical protein
MYVGASRTRKDSKHCLLALGYNCGTRYGEYENYDEDLEMTDE